MVAPSEKRLLWHPRRENRFVVGGGSQITLYEWMAEPSQIKHVTSQLDLSLMKCFTWSPDASFDDLIAVGLSTGRVDLMRLEATKYARNHVLSSGPAVSLPVRNSRSCNALAFSPVDTACLAAGLDKVRSDSSLIIWDIHTSTPTLSLSPSSPTSSGHASIAQPTVRPAPQIPRGEVGARADPRVWQLHAPADTVASLAFLPASPTQLLGGISHRWLRLFDLRTPLITAFGVASKVQSIATDPFEPNRIGCVGEGAVTIWDARRLLSPLLTFTERDAGADGARPRPGAVFATMEFSSTRRGVLATLERDATHVRFWDLQQAEICELPSLEGKRSRDSSQSGKATRSWTNPSSMLPWTGSSTGSSQASPARVPGESQAVSYNLVLSNTRRTKSFHKTLSSFALVPGATHALTSDVMVVNKEGDLELYAVHDTPTHTPWSARGDLAVGLGRSYRVLHGFHELEPPPEPWDIPIPPAVSVPGSVAHSTDKRRTREESAPRGRSGNVRGSESPAPMFGRGDEDGFPALPVKAPTNLAATRPGRTRTYSPAALRNLHFEHAAVAKTDAVPVPQAPVAVNGSHILPLNGGSTKIRQGHTRASSRHVRDGSILRKSAMEKTMQHLVEDDISMTMRRRVVQGYGLSSHLHNSIVAHETSPDDPTLTELWLWVHHAQQLLALPNSRLEGYNFANHGLQGIWDGLRAVPQPPPASTPRMTERNTLFDTPTMTTNALPPEPHATPIARHNSRRSQVTTAAMSEDFLAAIATLNERSGAQLVWRPSAHTIRLSQRQLALQLCGWSLAEDDLALAIKRWEKEGRHTQAACWLSFTEQYKQAVELLMRSKDESHHMMSGMLAALTPVAGTASKNQELIEHCERLIVRLQDPYLRAMLTHLTVREWFEVLQEDALPLRERLAIAIQFLDDRELSRYLRRVTERCCHDGDIAGIMVTGLTAPGIDILQAYTDITGDVQTAAILGALAPAHAHDVRVMRWLDTYRDLLDGWQLFHHRCQLDVDRGRLLQDAVQYGDVQPFEWAPKQVLIRCNYCNKPMDPPFSEASNPRATACPHCGKPLPRCSICLMTLSIVQDSSRHVTTHSDPRDSIDDALVFCQTCRHGGHASHILQWFYGEDSSRTHGTCPIAGCDCRCADEF
ncbi:hypothetical protein B0H21DRAFT_732415 [Amylocystis lapponica]|nr:hypothetical protein B0H21DRAFT_732415 [Amylocystis lapponica]